ncbi:MAG TPA: type II secretion system major pseudopilin GspG [Thermodesulfobacteriota bacterium]|nr:type II secretion system major pseudopilin GspG [Thermodesulfobacteriota bacterium]
MKEDRKKRNEKGFTLIELLIVMIIIGLLAALVAPRMFGKVEGAKKKAAKAQIEMFSTASDSYRLDVGKFPSALKDLRESSGDDKWEGPYLPKDIPLDPWENAYEYKAPGEHGDYDIISFGPNGQNENGEGDDIVSWKDK